MRDHNGPDPHHALKRAALGAVGVVAILAAMFGPYLIGQLLRALS